MRRTGISLAFAVGLLFSTCGYRISTDQGISAGGESMTTPLVNLTHNLNSRDSLAVLETATLFRIVDSLFWDYSLLHALTLQSFWRQVERRKEKSDWSEIEALLEYCRLQNLGTTISADEPDVRWALFLTRGIPTAHMQIPSICSSDLHDTCITWIYAWRTEDSATEVVCEAQVGGTYPVRVLPMNEHAVSLAGPIYPYVESWSFASRDGRTRDVWVGVWIPGHYLSMPTLEKGTLDISLTVYSNDSVLVRESSRTGLQIPRATLGIARDRSRLFVSKYFHCQLLPGMYTATISIEGDDLNAGDQDVTILVHSSSEVSDLVLVKRGVEASGVSGLVLDGENYFAIPRGVELPRGIMVDAVLEMAGEFDGDQREVWITLRPLPPKGRDKSETVETFPIASIRHEDQSLWKEFSKMPVETKVDRETATLFKDVLDLPERPAVLRIPIELTPRKDKFGPWPYIIAAQVCDPRNHQILGTRWALVTLRP